MRNVTIVTLMSPVSRNSSADRFCVLPGAMVPKFSLPGFFFAASTMSLTVLSGPPPWWRSSDRATPCTETDLKSRNTSYGNDLNSDLLIARAVAGKRQRVAVRRSAGAGLGGEDAAGAGPVLDDELLAKALVQLLGEQAWPYVSDAARSIGHQNPHRPVRIAGPALGRDRRGLTSQRQQQQQPRLTWRSVCRRSAWFPSLNGQLASHAVVSSARRACRNCAHYACRTRFAQPAHGNPAMSAKVCSGQRRRRIVCRQ